MNTKNIAEQTFTFKTSVMKGYEFDVNLLKSSIYGNCGDNFECFSIFDIVFIHWAVVELTDYDNDCGRIVNPDILKSLPPADLDKWNKDCFLMVSEIIYKLIKNRPFTYSNKRTALITALYYLGFHGYVCDKNNELEDMMAEIEEMDVDDEGNTTIIYHNLKTLFSAKNEDCDVNIRELINKWSNVLYNLRFR